jgi:hypothetical protein
MAAAKWAKFSLKTPDAMHWAVDYYGCCQFWNNDDRLKSVSPIIVNVV